MQMRKTTGYTILGLIILALVISPYFMFNMWENLDANHMMVIQAPFSGQLTTYTEPGVYAQNFGKVTKYPRRVTYSFSNSEHCKQRDTDGYPPFVVQFNDGGTGELCGSLQWEMPIKPEFLVKLQKEYASTEAIDQQLVQKALNNAVYFSGPTMSSIESTAERKPQLLSYIDDQTRNGTYSVEIKTTKVKDPTTGLEREVTKFELIKDEKTGKIARSSGSAMNEFGIGIVQLAISEIHYDDAVRGQIKVRQDAINQVQVSIANAKKAEQETITIAEQGKAGAAKAEWDQKTINAKEVALAEKDLQVATLAARTAEQRKRESILLGEGEAARKQLVMNADGALEPKLKTYLEAQKVWADAFKGYSGAMVPGIVMGGGNSTQNAVGNAQVFMDLMGMKAAKDLSLDMSLSGQGKTAKK